MRELEIHGVRIEMPSGVPMLLLREVQGSRALPIWIGAAEAAAIANALEGVEPPRPLTHDLFTTVLDTFGHTLQEVRITALSEGTFYALLVIDGEQVSARPSDAVALALRCGAPIYGAPELLDEVGVEIVPEREEEVEKFREFLDNISPEDFENPQES
ncbi:MAG TPA: bifunctional nuclease family protein [Propionibacteriaceae bacterium]|nr:bifunctional nuclease family protein [Propionibacteriaceae bacterium]HPZ50209.1 bifunctional nuclease family protein [Propionibacteriaceae bacterium]HQE30575.1 bifunctional nuclease family protein [Propionibacteriaceae bacterium]